MTGQFLAVNFSGPGGEAALTGALASSSVLSLGQTDLGVTRSPACLFAAQPDCAAHVPRAGLRVVCTGVISNHAELAAELRDSGKAPQVGSAAELIAYGYRAWGDDLAVRIRGAASFAIWDEQSRELVLVSDRYGERALFSTQTPDGIAVATDLKWLLALPGVEARPNYLGIHDFVQIRHAVPPMTCFEGIARVMPARIMRIRDGQIREDRPYWRRARQDRGSPLSRDEAAEIVLAGFDDAVGRLAESDRPVGALLSGGVDSGAIVARLSQMRDDPVMTFCAAFPQDGFNEVDLARLAADRYATNHHVYVMGPEVLDRMGELVWHYGSPFTDSSSLVTTAVMVEAAQHVDVLLGGDGAEQVFLGANRYYTTAKARHFQANGGRLPNAFEPVLAAQGETTLRDVLLRNTGVFRPAQKRDGYGDALAPYLLAPSADRLGLALDAAPPDEVMDTAAEIESRSLLMATFLIKNTVAAHYAGVEIRMPFLDHVFSDMVTALPHELRVFERFGEDRLKGLLRYVMEPYLDHQVLYGQNLGFGVPIREWFRKEMRDFLTDILLSRRFLERGLFTRPFVERMLSQHLSGEIDHAPRLWCMINLELWFRTFMDRDVSAGPLNVVPR